MRADSLILSGLSLVLLAACGCTQDLTTGLDEDARQAIEIGCLDRPGDARRTCEQTLARLYLAGRLELDALVSARYPLADWPRLVEDMKAGRIARGVLEMPGGR